MKQLLLFLSITFLFSCKNKEAEIDGNQFYFNLPQPSNGSEFIKNS